ncbi:MAG TPA: hypothetical protein VGM80_04585 [Gaiellaceae bacterium]
MERVLRWARIGNRAGLAGLAVLCVLALGSAMPLLPPKPVPTLDVWQQVVARCRHYARERMTEYPWPVKPFDEQHPVRGNFGDPRTVFTAAETGTFSFHSGVDISAWPGNPVYPVVSGTVVRATGDVIAVSTVDARRFQYVHLKPLVHVGETVIASKTVLGRVRARWNHVHLTEIRDNCTMNPLMKGHLTPYADTTKPTVRAILFQTPARTPISSNALTGKIRIVADAYDTPALPSPYPWNSLPVAPVHVTWALSTLKGRYLVRQTAADFRYSEPFRFQFCSVYAQSTEQNFAAVQGTYEYGKAGHYLFDLTPNLLNTAYLPNGRYRVTVTALDTAGNRGTQSVVVDVSQRPGTQLRIPPDTRCASEPAPTMAQRSGIYATRRS